MVYAVHPSASAAGLRFQSPEYREALKALKSPVFANGTVVTLSGATRRELALGAQELARALGRTLYRVDLNQISSKYLGETEKHIEMIFGQALASSAILYFEDGDALFGSATSSTGAKDGPGTQSASFLVERLAAFRGIIVALLSQATVPSPRHRMRRLHITFPAARV
jgi:SpoVK/Ycf46/Vps4 family AAA+-type ATPase